MIMLICYLLTNNKLKDMIWSLMYLCVFPFIYVIWAIALLFNLIKIIFRKGEKTWIEILKN